MSLIENAIDSAVIRQSKDIKLVKQPTQGKIYIIGDVHGNADVLDEAIVLLGPDDKLLLVGDLVDRGEENAEVIRLIQAINAKHPNKIISVRGNHENLTLNSLAQLEEMAAFLRGKSKEEFKKWRQDVIELNSIKYNEKYGTDRDDIRLHIMNGGKWLPKLFWNELNEAAITQSQDGVITYKKNSKVKMVHDYMNELPYILHVIGDDSNLPIITVHGDEPFDDDELYRRIASGEGLTPEEKEYATWARPVASGETVLFTDKGNTRVSIPKFVGHNIIAFGAAPTVRHETNTIDLDVASCVFNVAAMFCATDGTFQLVGKGVEEAKLNPNFVKIEQELNQKGEDLRALKNFYVKLKASTSAEEVRDATLAAVKVFAESAALPIKYSYAELIRFGLNTRAIDKNMLEELAKLDTQVQSMFRNNKRSIQDVDSETESDPDPESPHKKRSPSK